MCIWAFSVFLPPAQHNMADIAVVCAEAVLTFLISYPGAVALWEVFLYLHTAPERGLPGGQLKSFLRVMRELENHLHTRTKPLPALPVASKTESSPSVSR
ncbi:hypothetical protein FRB94_008603 [Tulasnella sp. JGI-2019a]|nr:hypothetical protein FRB94_008603 [Tulasnella sp. JGI-2019a]